MKRILFLIPLLVAAVSISAAQPTVKFTRAEDVIYGRKFGAALTMDVWKPEKPNGYGIVFLLSGGWVSLRENHDRPPFHQMYPPLVDAGYTVFTVVHGSQPKFLISEIPPDIHRAIRFVRHNASKYGIDPHRIGLMGASAGGHLTLTLATQGKDGDPKAPDPVDRESSRIQTAVAFYPPTDFLNYGKEGEDAVGVGLLQRFKPAFGPQSNTAEGRRQLGELISPARHISKGLPPLLLIHGDADPLVPFQQSELFESRAKSAGGEVKLIRKPGEKHGWADYTEEMKAAIAWFDGHLGARPHTP